MTLNTEEKTIAFQHNEEDLGVAYRNLDFGCVCWKCKDFHCWV